MSRQARANRRGPGARHVASALLALGAASAAAAPLPRFPPTAVWNTDVSAAAVHPQSASMIATLAGLGGFGFGRMQIDYSIMVLHAAAGAPTAAIVDGGGYFTPDCDPLGSLVPLPPGGAIEGNPGYQCDTAGEDCHLLVVQGATLYEVYNTTQLPNGNLAALCLATWQLDAVYPPEGRGEHCTSADAAGFPIAPLLFNADDVYAALQKPSIADRHLGHAIRFILPNPRMAGTPKVYVRPASHAGGPSGPAATVPYGARLRLRADFNVAAYPAEAQVILRTMQRYGIVLADGGNIALTGESDRFTTRKWTDPALAALSDTRVFAQPSGPPPVAVTDFEVLDTGARIVEDYNCVRAPPPSGLLFANGFE